MDYYFILVQIIGLVGFIFLLISYYRKSTNDILYLQIISCLFLGIHYFLLTKYDVGAYSGLFVCLFEMIMDYLYYKTNLDNKLFISSIGFYILLGCLTFNNIFDLFSIFASIVDRYFLTKDRKYVVLGGICTYSLWLIYDISVNSIAGSISDSIIVLSNIYILLNKKK